MTTSPDPAAKPDAELIARTALLECVRIRHAECHVWSQAHDDRAFLLDVIDRMSAAPARDAGGVGDVHVGMLDDLDHEAKLQQERRVHALGAAISRRDWHAVEQAHATIRDAATPAPARTAEGQVERVAELAEAVGRVLTWAHKVEGVVVVREDHIENLRKANIAARAALAAHRGG